MRYMIDLILLAGLVQLIIAASNIAVRQMLKPANELVRVSPMIRQIYFIHWIYIMFVVVVFAAVSFAFAPVLASGLPLARFLCAVMALFWLARLPIQFFYYDRAMRRTHRVIDVTCISAFVFLGVVYSLAASGVWQ